MKDKKNKTRNESLPGEKKSERKYSPIIVTSVFFVLTVIGLYNHELWRDEYQAWMLATNSSSITDLFFNLRYDGHPALWHSLSFFISKVFASVAAMQFLHLAIATANVWMINKYSPFSWYNKILASFGYYTFYEYAIISRNYGLGLFFVLLFCVLYQNKFKNIIWLCIVIFFMANTQTFAFMISVACLGFLIYELIFHKDDISVNSPFNIKTYFGFAIALTGILLAYKQISPPADGGFFDQSLYTKGFNSEYLNVAISRITNALFAIPKTDTVDNWNSNYFFEQTANSNLLPGCFLFIMAVVCFINNKRALVFYLLGTTGLLLFFYLTAYNFILARYVGHLFVVLFAAFWINDIHSSPNKASYSNLLGSLSARYSGVFFTVILSLQFIGGFLAYKNDLFNNFSNSADAAAYIKKQKLESLTIVGTWDYVASSISGALNKEIYYPEKRDFGTYILWNKARLQPLQFTDLTNKCFDFYEKDKKDVVLILNNALTMPEGNKTVMVKNGALGNGYHIHLLKSFDKPCICKDENYHIYLINKTQ